MVLRLMAEAAEQSVPAATEWGTKAGAAATMAEEAIMGTLNAAAVMMAMQVAPI